MADYVTLLGAEQVSSASCAMRDAASEMKRAASEMAYAFETHHRFMDDWLLRFTDTVTQQSNKGDK